MPAKKPKVTDWRIIAMSGKTADGREISARHLQEMASQYNPEKYAARINLEHLRFIFPYPEVTGYGDVVELKAEKQPDGKTALLAKLAVNDNLQELWDADQKVFSSIEIHPDFSDTGKAYLVGVAVTDSPASLGTEMLQFAQKHPDANPLTKRKQDAGNLFTEAVETAIELDADAPPADTQAFSDRIKGIVAKAFGRQKADADQRFADIAGGMDELATAITEQAANQGAAFAEQQDAHEQLTAQFADLQKQHADLLAQLDLTPQNNHTQRPPATGGAGIVLTDC